MISFKIVCISIVLLVFFEELNNFISQKSVADNFTSIVNDEVLKQEAQLIDLGHNLVNLYKIDTKENIRRLEARNIKQMLDGVTLQKVYSFCSNDSIQYISEANNGQFYSGNCSKFEFNRTRISMLNQFIFRLFDDGCFYGMGKMGLNSPLRNGDVYFGWLEANPMNRQSVWVDLNNIKKNLNYRDTFKIANADELIIKTIVKTLDYNLKYLEYYRNDTLLVSDLLKNLKKI